MSNVQFLLPKDDDALPDYYGITVTLINSKVKEYEVASHSYLPGCNVLSIVTKDDLWVAIPLSNILEINYDKQFSKVVEIANKKKNKDAPKAE